MESDQLSRNISIPSLRPERIIFAVDISDEMDMDMKAGPPIYFTSRMEHTRRVLHEFVEMKSRINKQHQFGIIIYTDKAQLNLDYSSDYELIHGMIDALETKRYYKTFSLCSLLEILHSKVPRSAMDDNYIYRTILIYGRSNIIPSPINMELLEELFKNRSFYIDVVYLHSNTAPDNNPQAVYDRLGELDKASNSYFFQATTKADRYSTAMCKLLGNPAQRVPQESVSYQIKMIQ